MTDDPFVRCCETCVSFRRTATGWPICMAVMQDAEDRAVRDRALKACNALCRCRLFTPLADTNQTQGGDHEVPD